MKIAYISPFPPKKTGIAQYSHHLANALIEHSTLKWDFYDAAPLQVPSQKQTTKYQATKYQATKYQLQNLNSLINNPSKRAQYTNFLYHIGNNAQFHFTILRLLRQQPGVVLLHDTVLYHLMVGQSVKNKVDSNVNDASQELNSQTLASETLPKSTLSPHLSIGGLWLALSKHLESQKEKLISPKQIIEKIQQASFNSDPVLYPHPEKYPLLEEVVQLASSIIVHSHYAKEQIRKIDKTIAVNIIPFIQYQASNTVSEHKIENKKLKWLSQAQKDEQKQRQFHQPKLIIGLFGFAGETKRIKSIVTVLNKLPKYIKNKIKILIVGSAQVIELESIQQINFGYINDEDYTQAIRLTDIIINLRYPSMGETSAIQMQLMAEKKASIVTNFGWFKELPDNAVIKIDYQKLEKKDLQTAIMKLVLDEQMRQNIAKSAYSYILMKNKKKIIIEKIDMLTKNND